jgi:thioredoxin-like negative regulator of GroEL
MRSLSVMILMILTLPLIASQGQEVFLDGGFSEAKEKAIREGKMQFVKFSAKWCLPCKHMEQTTFKDPDVQELLNQHFASAKVDIDNFDGFSLKQEYDVRFLPTIIVLDDQGQEIARFEESMGPTELRYRLEELIEKYITALPKPESTIVVGDYEEPAIQEEAQVSQPRILLTNKSILQFGVFRKESNAVELYQRITQYLPSSPEIKIVSDLEGRISYAVHYGPFEDRSEAEEVKEELDLLGFDALIKKMQ